MHHEFHIAKINVKGNEPKREKDDDNDEEKEYDFNLSRVYSFIG
jgi:hypothetical protein